MESTYGVMCLLPVATILVIAIATKRTLFAMICGTIVASLILAGDITNFMATITNNLYAGMSNPSAQWIMMIVAMFGILIVLYERSGAIADFALWARKFVKTEKQVLFGTIVMGILVFVDDYLNNLAVSTTMKGLTDDLRIPRTKLAYIVNTVAAPVCLLIPVSSWAAYYTGLLAEQNVLVDGSSTNAYLSALPLSFYPWIMLILAVLVVLGVVPDLGLIKKDALRAKETGNVFPDGIVPTSAEHESGDDFLKNAKVQPIPFVLPLAVMIVISLWQDVLMGVIAGTVLLCAITLITRRMKFFELLTTCFDGVMSMGFVFLLTILAFTVSGMNLELQLAEFVISVTLPVMKGAFLPVVVFLVCAAYSYATGCFWDLAVIVVPIVIPLANAMGVDPILAAAAIFSGTAFGSNTCLYGDGVIICSQGAEIKPLHLMLATLPYALIAAGISCIGFLIAGFMMH